MARRDLAILEENGRRVLGGRSGPDDGEWVERLVAVESTGVSDEREGIGA